MDNSKEKQIADLKFTTMVLAIGFLVLLALLLREQGKRAGADITTKQDAATESAPVMRVFADSALHVACYAPTSTKGTPLIGGGYPLSCVGVVLDDAGATR